jgi:hypothetical protein
MKKGQMAWPPAPFVVSVFTAGDVAAVFDRYRVTDVE